MFNKPFQFKILHFFDYYFLCQALMLTNVFNWTPGFMSLRHLKDSIEVSCVVYVQKERMFHKRSCLHLRTCTGNPSGFSV